jgi:hypothetical protein
MAHVLRSQLVALLILAAAVATTAQAQGAEEKPIPDQKTAEKMLPPKERRRPLPAMPKNVMAPSHVFQHGGLEILTYETEQGYDRLEEHAGLGFHPNQRHS